MRVLALTGTPGTGKSTIAALLSPALIVVEARALADACGAIVDRDEARDSLVVDEDTLSSRARGHLPDADVVVEGLVAHFCDPDVTVVLRCHPDTLRARLAERGWSAAKVDENVMAETLDAMAFEVEAGSAWELDTTELAPEEAASVIARLFKGEAVHHPCLHPLGGVDWSDVLLREDKA